MKEFWLFELFTEAKGPGDFPPQLRRVVAVPMDKLIMEYGGEVKFTDDKPPLLFLAQVIWDCIFSIFPSDSTIREDLKRGGKTEFTASAEELKEKLNQFFSFKSILFKHSVDKQQAPLPPEAIRKDWVVEVLEFLKRHDLVEEVEGKSLYRVKFKKLRPNTLDHLIKCLAEDELTPVNSQECLLL
jgi:hypothetical protein